MKMTKTEIAECRQKLVEKILEINDLRKSADVLKEHLADDFATNAEKYLTGIATPSGLLIRKPHSYDVLAKRVAEA